MKLIFVFIFISVLNLGKLYSQDIPLVYSNIKKNANGDLYFEDATQKYYLQKNKSKFNLENMKGNPQAEQSGISFDFGDENFFGTLYFGLIDYTDSKHASPVYFRENSKIIAGRTIIDIKKNLSAIYDMIDWEKTGKGTIGYRIVSYKGQMIYDGVISFYYQNEKFEIAPTIIQGPFISNLTESGLVIWFETNFETKTEIDVNSNIFLDTVANKIHKFTIDNLNPNTEYKYRIKYGNFKQEYSFKTATKKGSRNPFVFSYASDSRGGTGGGERDFYGTNAYIMKRICALATKENSAFMQFSGDLITGYAINEGDMNLQYANWKRAVEPYAKYFPIYTTAGNHEAYGKAFVDSNGKQKIFIDNFPFDNESAEVIFANNFVNPENGPKSEDGSVYDPDSSQIDFPPYSETVYSYVYGNVGFVVLNTDYFYASYLEKCETSGGNLHAYIMDNQLEWLKETIEKFENDNKIDHVFVSLHTPAFPNGGHVKDDMWYNSNNYFRPVIAGKRVEKGIIERRDEFLDILINRSSKVLAMLTGDEHNYNKVKISPDVNIYPENYKFSKLTRKRTIWQINNGAAGAPYYAQDKSTPWTNAVSGFTTQNALVLVYVNGNKVVAKVMNPDTLETFDEFTLKD